MSGRWLNIFIRDIFLIVAVLGIHFLTEFKSRSAFLVTGMLLILISWQLSSLMNEIKINSRMQNGLDELE